AFVANGAGVVLDSVSVYNPRVTAVIFTGYLSSLNQTDVMQFIGVLSVFLILAAFLAADSDQRCLFKRGTLLATGGFFVSLSPLLITGPNHATTGEQDFALLIMLGCWCVLALATGLRVLVGRVPQVTDGAPRAP